MLSKVKRRPARRSRMSPSEKIVIAEVVNNAPGGIVSDIQADRLAMMLQRSPTAITSAIASAREQFLAKANDYVDLHNRTVHKAFAQNDLDVARKGSEWAIEHMSGKNDEGEIERIIDKDDSQSNSPRISIGIALGGLPGRK